MRRLFTWRTAGTILLVVACLACLFPLYWVAATALKVRAEQIAFPPVWIPTEISWQSFRETFVEREFSRYLVNSTYMAALATVLSMAMGTPAGYSLARFRFPGRFGRGFGFWVLSTRMLPPIVSVIPIYYMFRELRLLDTPVALVASYAVFNLPFVVWMMRSFFREIPKDLEEAAMVDGLSRLQAFLRITLPLAAPGLAATAIFVAILSFNEFLFALTLTTLDAVTLPVGIAGRVTQYKVMWGQMSAAGLVAMVPIIVFALLVQRHLVKGLTLGAVKG